jgi:hypothetical protein
MALNSPTSASLTILLFNCNGFWKRKDEIDLVLHSRRIDILLLTETHLTPRHTTPNIQGYRCYRADHPDGTAHAGSAILIRTSLQHNVLNPFLSDYIQATKIAIQISNSIFEVSSIYCPPRHIITQRQFKEFFDSLGSHFICGGDFNSKHHQWGSRTITPKGRSLNSVLNESHLQFISPPFYTYWPTSPRKRPDLLDFFITKSCNFYRTLESLDELSSDHSSVLLVLHVIPLPNYPKPTLTPGRIDWDRFTERVDEIITLQIPLKTSTEIELGVEHFNSTIQQSAWLSCRPQHLPPPGCPSYPLSIRQAIAEKRRLRRIWQTYRDPTDKRNYNRMNNVLKNLVKTFKVERFQSYLSCISGDDRSIWLTTRKILKTHYVSPPIRKHDNTWAKTDSEKADVFASHLSTVFKPHNISNMEQEEHVQGIIDSPLPMSLPPLPFTPREVLSEIRNLPSKKAPGYDLITSEILKRLPRKAIVFLTYIFNAILRIHEVPLQWKVSQVFMVPKPNKPPDIPASYRPISLLPVCSKLFEKLLLRRLMVIIADEKVLPNHQFGFRKDHSAIQQVHRVVDFVACAFENKNIVTSSFLDISQAFDRVWHNGLLSKLRFLPYAYFLIMKSFLRDRFFFVSQGNSQSDYFPILAGVPQGTILSPILYSIYTHDFPTSQDTTTCTYADDTAILSESPDPVVASDNLQRHLVSVHQWLSAWKMKLNINKSQQATFTLRPITCPTVTVDNTALTVTDKIRYLGLTLDRRFTWRPHLTLIRERLDLRFRKLYGILGRHSSLPLNIKVKLYKSLIQPIWLYGSPIFGSCRTTTLNLLQRHQSKSLRIMANAPYYVTNHTLHSDLQIPTVSELIKNRYTTFHSKTLNHTNPYISQLSNPLPIRRRLRRRWNRDLLRPP